MKRNNSSVCLKNLAMSIKNSIKLDIDRTVKRQFIPLKTARSTINLRTKGYEDIATNTSLIPPKERLIFEQGELKTAESKKFNKKSIVDEQIDQLQADITKLGKFSIRNYSAQLKQFDKIQFELQEYRNKQNEEQIYLKKSKQQQNMLKQDLRSIHFNIQQQLAQKQYYEQLIITYNKQYPKQSKLLQNSIKIQLKYKQLQRNRNQIQKFILQKNKELIQWKQQQQYILIEKKTNNHLKELRISLMNIEEQLDQQSASSNKKLRQYMCLYLKHHPITTCNQINMQDGLQIHLCREGLVTDFNNYIKRKYHKDSLINKYCSYLQNIEILIKNKTKNPQQIVYTMMNTALEQKKKQFGKIKEQINILHQELLALQSQIQLVYGNQSITFIQYLQQTTDKYDIRQIRNKLKLLQKQQQLRRKTISIALQYQFIYQNKNMINNNHRQQQQIQQEIQKLKKQQKQQQKRINENEKNKDKLKKQKQKIEIIISNAIIKWKQYDYKKQKLKILYKKLPINKKYEQNQYIQNKNIINNFNKCKKLIIKTNQQKYKQHECKRINNNSQIKTYNNNIAMINNNQFKILNNETSQYYRNSQFNKLSQYNNKSCSLKNNARKPLGENNQMPVCLSDILIKKFSRM